MAASPSLTFASREFLLDGRPLRILSGAIHYFRVVPGYWRDRLLKMKACGINTLETYVPWNLHEPKPGSFKDDGLLDVRKFIKMAGDLGLHVIFRPGPYICSEWDFGGLPSWLLADPDMKVRSNYGGYTAAVERFFGWLLPLVSDLQRSKGGPIIAVQVENEFGSFSDDPDHMIYMRDLLLQHGVTELLVSCDNESACGTGPIVEGVLPTANGQTVEEVRPNFEVIKAKSAEFPLMVMELWTGWFDHWGLRHETRDTELLQKTVEYCFKENGSINLYMFHGGTNFGFMAGALNLSRYKADTTSYDYDAPLSEEGILTPKALKIREMIQEEAATKGLELDIPATVPDNPKRAAQPITLMVEKQMSWNNLTKLVAKRNTSQDLNYMESFVYDAGEVQSYGYIVYRNRTGIPGTTSLCLPGPVRDRVTVLVDGEVQGEVITREKDDPPPPVVDVVGNSKSSSVLDIIVENLGRVNYTTTDNQHELNTQRKGLRGTARLGDRDLHGWEVLALDFSEDFVSRLAASVSWENVDPQDENKANVPAVFKVNLNLTETPSSDYFVRLDQWGKGLVFVNGFNLGRYWSVGPTLTLYLPAPLLKEGPNDIIVFEEVKAGASICLDVKPDLDRSLSHL